MLDKDCPNMANSGQGESFMPKQKPNRLVFEFYNSDVSIPIMFRKICGGLPFQLVLRTLVKYFVANPTFADMVLKQANKDEELKH